MVEAVDHAGRAAASVPGTRLELFDLERSEEAWLLVCGLWLIVSPFVLGYADSGTLAYWHVALGIAVVLLAALELWQDWKLSEEELLRHG